MVGEMNEMDCELKEIKMKHDQWSVDSRKRHFKVTGKIEASHNSL